MRTDPDVDRTRPSAPWVEFASSAPGLAEQIRGRFGANRHHVIATIRADGSPRLSGTEIDVRGDEVTLGMMAGSAKLADVRRDPRVEIHSAPLEDDLASGDAKLAGVLVGTAEAPKGPPGSLFQLAITLASLVRVEGDELVVTSWRPEQGIREVRRR